MFVESSQLWSTYRDIYDIIAANPSEGMYLIYYYITDNIILYGN